VPTSVWQDSERVYLLSRFYLLAFLFFLWPRVFAFRVVALFVLKLRNALLNRISNSRSFSEAFCGDFFNRLADESALTRVRECFIVAACSGGVDPIEQLRKFAIYQAIVFFL